MLHVAGLIEQLLKDLRYGEIRLTVQDGKVVLVEKTEKIKPNA